MSARCFCFPWKLFTIIELKLACFCIQLVRKHLRITLGKSLVVTETWHDKKDHRYTPVGNCPRQKYSDLRPNHLLTKFKRKVLTCFQTKAIVNCNHNPFTRWLKRTFICNQRRDVAWQLSRIEMRYTCLEEVPHRGCAFYAMDRILPILYVRVL